jgi:hypothetical protein
MSLSLLSWHLSQQVLVVFLFEDNLEMFLVLVVLLFEDIRIIVLKRANFMHISGNPIILSLDLFLTRTNIRQTPTLKMLSRYVP